jgi:hypothetical protein
MHPLQGRLVDGGLAALVLRRLRPASYRRGLASILRLEAFAHVVAHCDPNGFRLLMRLHDVRLIPDANSVCGHLTRPSPRRCSPLAAVGDCPFPCECDRHPD